MSRDDEVAEGTRMGGAVAAATGLPVLGLTRGTDGTWSGRFWLRAGRNEYVRADCETVRVTSNHQLRMSFHPTLRPVPEEQGTQVATISVWGSAAQADLARTRVGVVGLGSVGGIVAEGLSRTGLQEVLFLDHDRVELRNLDRTLGALREDVPAGTPKVRIAERLAMSSHTAANFRAHSAEASLLTAEGLSLALDCDVLICCVDRPWPRAVMNLIAVSHLIPVVDGGILAAVAPDGRPLHVDWRIQTVTAGRACLYCLDALRRSDVALDRTGKLDDPDYMRGLTQADRERYARRNVFAFSLAVAAHQLQQFVGLVTGMVRIGGKGPQHYSVYPGQMTVDDTTVCHADCEVGAHVATAVDLGPWLLPTRE
ncbi:ThiF family adenylyltransferase [Candidatus Amarobacter glycogenicus]|uniref:ThiF family adenylyltransferase n=1 Tax=Candidatus Amarobacter glycogenicus TaxID=3140699 RepID=UPI002A16086F|nr:ThiF family adenylyltransferase [Dehalococcoidia bacterium]